MTTYLNFEQKIAQIQEDLVSAQASGNTIALAKLQKDLEKEVAKTFGSLSDYQKLQLARHPDRPYALDYIRAIMENAYEIHGDRAFRDDPAIVCYIGRIGGQKAMVIGEQKRATALKTKSKEILGCPIPKATEKRFVQSSWQKSSISPY